MSRFAYVLEKLERSEFKTEPFKHIQIDNLLDASDFKELVASPQIDISPAANDQELIDKLYEQSYAEIKFPGTTTDIPAYLQWHGDRKNHKNLNIEICEGFGVTMRLKEPQADSIVSELHEFFKGREFWSLLAKRFDLNLNALTIDTGLQKYLDGYEISPHPDIRRKALTFMLNLNPATNSEQIEYHTHYMKFTPERDYVRKFWASGGDWDRCWVPWDWCTTVKRQVVNNSVVIFSPADDTMHAVRASYDHLGTQRTQFYGNLWYKDARSKKGSYWVQFKDPAQMPELTIS